MCTDTGDLVSGSTGGAIQGDLPVDQLYVFVGRASPDFSAGRVSFDAGLRASKVFHDDATLLCNHDLALILLTTEIPNAPLAQVRFEGEPTVGEAVTAAGFGIDETSKLVKVRKERAGIPIVHVGPYAGGADPNVDPPSGANEFQVGEATCSGDSGGAVLSEKTGAVIGIVSAGGHDVPAGSPPAAKCMGSETRNGYTKTAPFQALIRQALAEAGHEPWLENGRDPRLPPESPPSSCAIARGLTPSASSSASVALAVVLGAWLAARRRLRRQR